MLKGRLFGFWVDDLECFEVFVREDGRILESEGGAIHRSWSFEDGKVHIFEGDHDGDRQEDVRLEDTRADVFFSFDQKKVEERRRLCADERSAAQLREALVKAMLMEHGLDEETIAAKRNALLRAAGLLD